MTLRTDVGLADPDGFYERLIDAHRGLDEAAGRQLDARLILLLANHIGDAEILDEALEEARRGLDETA
jgi:hypothetical protein